MTRGDEMSEKKKLREQMAVHRTYSPRSLYHQPEPIQIREGARGSHGKEYSNMRNVRAQQREPQMEVRTLHRVVTVPEADPSQAWNTFAQRQEQMRRERSRVHSQRYVVSQPVARTYARTGTYATSGRLRAIPRVMAKSGTQASPIPIRSGRKSWLRNVWLRLISLFAIVAVLILVGNLMFTSNAFRIAQVNVLGTHDQALIAQIQRMGMQGQNIFLVNVEGVTEQVEASPLVASATLSKDWPNQLTVTVTERVPVLLWQTAHGIYSVDKQGVVIASVGAVTDSSMTVVDARRVGKGQKDILHPGMRLDTADVRFASTIFQQLPLLTGIHTFTLRYQNASDGSGVFVVQSSQGWSANLGGVSDSNPLDNRLMELQQILQLAQQRQLTLATVDVRYGLYPVYTLK